MRRLSFLFALFFSSVLNAQVPKVWEEQSNEIKGALKILGHVEENQIHSDLQGRSSGSVKIILQIETLSNFHIYEDKLKFSSEKDEWSEQFWEVEQMESPPTIHFFDPVTRGLKRGFKGENIFVLKAKIPQEVQHPYPLSHQVPLVVSLQICNDKICLFPTSIRLPLEISGPSQFKKAPLPSSSFVSKLGEPFKKSSAWNLEKFSLLTLLLLFLAGVLTAFTPCVYPLYPITLGIFSRWSQRYHTSPLLLTLSYCGGLTLSYAMLGLLSAGGGIIFGALTQKPVFLIGVGLLILGSALAFSGLIPFKAPEFLEKFFLKESTTTAKTHGGYTLLGKSFFMGAGLGVVASPCVGPVLIAILSWLGTALSQGGSRAAIQGFTYLAFFGLGMSLPFFVLGHFIIRLHKRPHLGKYTPYFKHIGTALMVLASLYFLVPGISLLRTKGAGTASNASLPHVELKDWQRSRWAVVDFRADWCGACIELEDKTFAHPRVRPLFDNKEWDYVRVDLTEQNPVNEKIANDFGVKGLPTVQIFSPSGKACLDQSLFGFEEAQAFLERLQEAQAHCR